MTASGPQNRAIVFLALALGAGACSARAADIGRSDLASLLYSAQLAFTADNVPVVPVGVLTDAREAVLDVPGGVLLYPGGRQEGTVEMPRATRWRAHVEGGRPAVIRWFVRLARLPARQSKELAELQARWQRRGTKLRLVEHGTVFGFYGHTLDTRRVNLLVDEPFATEEAARGRARALEREFGERTLDVVSLPVHRPTGTIVLTDGVEVVRARDFLRLRARSGKPIAVHDVVHGKGFAWERRAVHRYAGDIVLAVSAKGTLALVDVVDLETLLEGIVPSEIYPTAPLQALEAQAVVARGEILARLGHRHWSDPFVLCSDVHCQVYKGVGNEKPRTTKAVRATRGWALFRDGALVPAAYSANCGGHTENNEVVWGGEPNAALRGLVDGARQPAAFATLADEGKLRDFLEHFDDAWCARASRGRQNYRWRVELSADQLDALVARKFPDLGHVRALAVDKRGVSGRARVLRIDGMKRSVRVTGELAIRKLLGGLKSAMFVVEVRRDRAGRQTGYVLRGGGFGHGVGMCQTGAIGAAEAGWDWRRILRHYYRGAEARRLY